MGKGDPKGGRPRFELSDEDFAKLIGMIRIQCTQEEICGIYGIDHKTLNEALKRRGEPGFSQLFKRHQDEGKASLRRAQWKAAVEKHNPTMLVWMGKQMLGQKDKVAVGGDEDAPPIKHEVTALDRIASRLAGLAAAGSATGDPGGSDGD